MNSILMFGIGLALCGFMLMGPDSLLAGVGAIDVGVDDRLYWQQDYQWFGIDGPNFQRKY